MIMLTSTPKILFEDQDLMVINKPAGLVVNQADSVKVATLQDWLQTLVPQWQSTWVASQWQTLVPADFPIEFGSPESVFSDRVGIGHRLDKDTSGCLVIAKNPGALVQLLKQFRERLVKKTYTCLVHGGFGVKKGEINAPLTRSASDRRQFAVSIDGRPAVTAYQVEREFLGLKGLVEAGKLGWSHLDPEYQAFQAQFAHLPLLAQKQLRQHKETYDQGFSLVSCWPKTGRTHQIRVHLTHLHHPLVGDQVYVGRKRAQLDALWCPRQFLHASRLELTHPRTHQPLVCEAPLPPELQQVLEFLVEV